MSEPKLAGTERLWKARKLIRMTSLGTRQVLSVKEETSGLCESLRLPGLPGLPLGSCTVGLHARKTDLTISLKLVRDILCV